MNTAVIGFMKYSKNSQRGINVITDALRKYSNNITYYPFPVYSLKNLTTDQVDNINVKNIGLQFPYKVSSPTFLKRTTLKLVKHNYTKKFKPELNDKDLIVIESGKPVLLHSILENKNYIYRQSDPVEYLLDPYLKREEHQIIINSKLTLVVNKEIYDQYKKDYPEFMKKIVLWENGFLKPRNDLKNPFKKDKNVVYFGLFPINWDAILMLANSDKSIDIHLFGPHKNNNIKGIENIINHGYVNHEDIIPYIKYSNVCLLPYENIESRLKFISMTSKLLTYMYYKKPIVASFFKDSKNLRKYGIITSKNNAEFCRNVTQNIHNGYNYSISFENYSKKNKEDEFLSLLEDKNIIS